MFCGGECDNVTGVVLSSLHVVYVFGVFVAVEEFRHSRAVGFLCCTFFSVDQKFGEG